MSFLKKKFSFSFFRNVVIVLSIASSAYYLLVVDDMDIKSFLILSLVIFVVVTLLYFIFRNASEGVKLVVNFAIAVIFGAGALLVPFLSEPEPENKYTNSVEKFEEITVSGINTLKDDHDMFLYVGRETCPYCYEFAPKLAEAIQGSDTKIYYLDTESGDKNLSEFAENYEVNSVPTFVYLKDGFVVDKMDISNYTTSDDIRMFIDDVSETNSEVSYKMNNESIFSF